MSLDRSGACLRALSILLLGIVIGGFGFAGFEFGRMDIHVDRWRDSPIAFEVVAGCMLCIWGAIALIRCARPR